MSRVSSKRDEDPAIELALVHAAGAPTSQSKRTLQWSWELRDSS